MLLFTAPALHAQQITQTIKGSITDKDSKIPLPGATVYLSDTDPPTGTITNENGDFRLDNVETGRRALCVSYVGYEPLCLDNINLTSGKEIVLDIAIEESVMALDEVVVRAKENSGNATNPMAAVSSRTFSVEETQRFAGARNDVARMALNFAGVAAGNDATNEILVRGNSPNGLLWQLEGVETSNPNHFGFSGATGGPVGILNNNTLANSDFMTGAFAPGYGNAISGVFDLKMREGNHDKAEFLGQVGFNGFELGAEGPVSRKNNSSYLINYRYSTLGFFHLLGINFGTGVAVPEYQDVNFKVVSNLGRGKISLFGFGGISGIELLSGGQDSTDAENFYENAGYDIYNNNMQGIIGLKYFRHLGDKAYGEIVVSADGLQNKSTVDTVLTDPDATRLFERTTFINQNYALKITMGYKINSKLNVRIGGEARLMYFTLNDSIYMGEYGTFFNQFNDKGNTELVRAYAEGNWKAGNRLSFIGGLHTMMLTLNNELTIEPRLAVKFKLSPQHTLSAGYGRHSKMLPMLVYFRRVDISATEYTQPNKELGMVYADHVVGSWDWQINNLTRVKVEGYYQHLSNVAIEKRSSTFSMLNNNSFQFGIPDTLVNGGTGENIGLELTVEQFMNKGFYYLVTTSLFDSKYSGSDGITRSTVFDGDYVFNALAGKEFRLGSLNAANKKYITADLKLTAAGGQRYTPVDKEASAIKGETVYNDELTYSGQFRDYMRLDVRVAFRIDKPKYSHEFAVDVQNVTNRENPLYMQFNPKTGETEIINQLKLFPVAQYRIMF